MKVEVVKKIKELPIGSVGELLDYNLDKNYAVIEHTSMAGTYKIAVPADALDIFKEDQLTPLLERLAKKSKSKLKPTKCGEETFYIDSPELEVVETKCGCGCGRVVGFSGKVKKESNDS